MRELCEGKLSCTVLGGGRRGDTLLLLGNTPTVTASLQNLERLGIVREITGKQRGRVFVYDAYLKILERGTEPLQMEE
jgi:hypothetical protein